jgi:hypothetical protein
VNTSASPYSNLSVVILALRKEVGGWGLRGLLSAALVLLLYRRLGGICRDMERLAVRFQAGRLWRVRARAVAGERVVVEAGGLGRAVPGLIWPGRFGWLVRAASYHAAGFGSQLRTILVQPEIVELLVAAPQAVRILRPLCRMLAVETALLRPRPAAEAVEVVACVVVPVLKVRVRKARAPVDWGRIPLPRGVLAAARRRGFGKVPRD